MKPLITRAGWRDGVPALDWTTPAGRESTTLGGPVRWALGERNCIGHQVDGQRVACSTGLPPSGRQCRECQQADTFRPCMICTGFGCPRLSTAMRTRCDGLHHLYLATFGGSVVKVGTASKGRHDARLIEQGPLAAIRIASGAGPRIKQMEHLLSTRTPLVEAVRRSRKLTHLSAGGDPDVARGHVMAAYEVAVALLEDTYGDELHAPEWFVAPPLAERSRRQATGRTALPLTPGTLLRGRVVGAVGPIALLDDGPSRFLVDLGAMVGHLIDFDPPRDTPTPTVQLGLFA